MNLIECTIISHTHINILHSYSTQYASKQQAGTMAALNPVQGMPAAVPVVAIVPLVPRTIEDVFIERSITA